MEDNKQYRCFCNSMHVQGIGIGFIIVILLVFGLLFVTAPEKQSPTDQDMEHANKGTQYGNIVLIAVLSNALFLAVWFQSVVYRAYKYMEMNEMSIPTTHIKTENHKQDADTDAERCLKCIFCTML
ncbi:hypothetical protein Ddc_18853 [Ditylenchus destructor]|nr:hypothetical protein Ddc_18853 [Ditylenchus destructor]